MLREISVSIALFMVTLLLGLQAFGEEKHGQEQKEMRERDQADYHDDDDRHDRTKSPRMHRDDHKAPHGSAMQAHQHRHKEWVTPPPEYRVRRSTRWTDAAAIGRGKELFQSNCMVCHGADGKGTGPAAKGLPHPPADLTNHFHIRPGDGDAYLFWRISEGGQAEPFKSMGSVMPPFKTILSQDQRWDTLAYVHDQFHQGFKSETMPKSVAGTGKIIAVVPGSTQVVIEHGEIKGFMHAMTMGYKVQPASLLGGLKAGEEVRFTIDTQNNVIVKIKKLHQ